MDQLESGRLRSIRPLVERLDHPAAAAVAALVVERLRAELAAGRAGRPWMVTSLQYLQPPDAVPLLVESLQRLPRAGPDVHTRLLHALGVYAPLEALPALVDAVETLDAPDHRQLAAVCLGKVIARHGDAARRRLAPARSRLYAARQHLSRQADTVEAFSPEVPWDHRPGTPGWRAGVARAVRALDRLLDHLRDGP